MTKHPALQERKNIPLTLEDREKEKILLEELRASFHTKISQMLRASFDIHDEVEKSIKHGKDYTCISNAKLEGLSNLIVTLSEGLTDNYQTLTKYFDWCSLNGAVRNEILVAKMAKGIHEKLEAGFKNMDIK